MERTRGRRSIMFNVASEDIVPESQRSSSGWSDKWALDASQASATENSDEFSPKERAERTRKNSTRIAFAALFLSAIVFGLLTFFLVRHEEQEDFQAAFASYARETADIAEVNAEMTFGQLKVLSTGITSIAVEDKTKTFPYLTMPHFDLRSQEIADLTGIEMILFAPFVPLEQQPSWERFQVYSQEWILEDYEYRGWNASHLEPIPTKIHDYNMPDNYNETRPGFVDMDGFMEQILVNHSYTPDNFSAPVSQYGPGLVNTSAIMMDLLSHPVFKKEIITSLEYNVPVVSETQDLQFLLQYLQPPTGQGWDTSFLRSFTLHPVKENFHNDSRTVGYIVGIVSWNHFFVNLLPESIDGIVVTVVSDCGTTFTYNANGSKSDATAVGDWHDEQYDNMVYHTQFFWKDHPKGVSRHCHFDLYIYPSEDFESMYITHSPLASAAIVMAVFLVAAIVLYIYDKKQKRMQVECIEEKAQAEALVMDLFPKFVGRRLIQEHANGISVGKSLTGSSSRSGASSKDNGRRLKRATQSMQLSEYLNGPAVEMGSGGQGFRSKPLADLFPFATIMFADIVGFTAWSSVREPSQVFVLLETLYQNFDKIAKRRKIFKVETIGDCYVAVSGLPEPRRDHAPAMAMFSKECLDKFVELVETLEVELGPDTAELGLRTGLHSGPVTAGVLRGERARFQLFGDTVNTTARIESSGEKNRIHLSEECAQELRKFGKAIWVTPRKDQIAAKGKGILSTCWLTMDEDASTDDSEEWNDESSELSSISDAGQEIGGEETAPPPQSLLGPAAGRSKRMLGMKGAPSYRSKRVMSRGQSKKLSRSRGKSQFELLDEKNQRLIEWNTETLKSLLEAIVTRRVQSGKTSAALPNEQEIDERLREGKMVFDEVAEIINLPNYDQAKVTDSKKKGEVSDEIMGQIRKYVSTIAKLYPDNPFHNFDHASHVAMSVSKLLSRIVAPKMDKVGGPAKELQKRIHDHTYGITGDPLTQFACVFSSLIHDCEHDGVPNAQLVKEEHPYCARYKNISVAEQNSVDVAWEILMQPRFQELRAAIYSTEAEMVRFRQLVVNSVMATDIVDKNLKELRNARWEKAFQNENATGRGGDADDVNRKATVVIEHLIQASDVSHTMQHWHIFHKWNANLFREMYTAYKAGRSEKDPSEFWYKGEIGFFDFYIIPLAKKLKDCGVFGVSSDEYLNYAQSNRREWEQKGEDIVRGYIKAYEADLHAKKVSKLMEKQLSRQMSKSVLSSSSLPVLENCSNPSLGGCELSQIFEDPSQPPPPPPPKRAASATSPSSFKASPRRGGPRKRRVSFSVLSEPKTIEE